MTVRYDCPKCDSNRVDYIAIRVPLDEGTGTTLGGYWACRDCWCKFNGATDDPRGILPAGVSPREKNDDE